MRRGSLVGCCLLWICVLSASLAAQGQTRLVTLNNRLRLVMQNEPATEQTAITVFFRFSPEPSENTATAALVVGLRCAVSLPW